MDQNKKNKVKDFFRKEGFYLVLLVCLCVVATIAAFTIKKNSVAKEQNKTSNELSLNDVQDSSVIEDEYTKQKKFSDEYTQNVLKIDETLENLNGEKILEIFPEEHGRLQKYTTVVPILGSGQRLGTLVLSRYSNSFNDDDLVIAEYSATVVGLEILRAIGEELEEEMRKKAVVQMAIGTLSYSELEAVEHIFAELDGKEGLLVASKIADRVGITRSVIVNALRKFESAGVIESRSLGMKGTHIRILNDKLTDELKKLKNNQ